MHRPPLPLGEGWGEGGGGQLRWACAESSAALTLALSQRERGLGLPIRPTQHRFTNPLELVQPRLQERVRLLWPDHSTPHQVGCEQLSDGRVLADKRIEDRLG